MGAFDLAELAGIVRVSILLLRTGVTLTIGTVIGRSGCLDNSKS